MKAKNRRGGRDTCCGGEGGGRLPSAPEREEETLSMCRRQYGRGRRYKGRWATGQDGTGLDRHRREEGELRSAPEWVEGQDGSRSAGLDRRRREEGDMRSGPKWVGGQDRSRIGAGGRRES
ncbi:hypothetical protein ACLOJK_031036 [Asimina triloba]